MLKRFNPFLFNDYPTSDGKPMAETDHHRIQMFEVIHMLERWYADDPNTYVTGNLLLFYDKGNKRRHVSPDCFVVKGVPKGERPNYLLWEEKPPNVVFEITSKTTRREDAKKKLPLYRDVLKVQEYFLFDPFKDYLTPSMQGYRRVRGELQPIEWVNDRIPSRVLGLHLERDRDWLRLWNPETGRWLLYDEERHEDVERRAREAEEHLAAEKHARDQAERVALAEQQTRELAEAELARLRAELERLRQPKSNGKNGAH